MYKLAVPISITTLNEKSLPIFVERFQRAGVERVFLCCLVYMCQKSSYLYNDPEKMAYFISYFKEKGFEVGVWEYAIGHGDALAHAGETSLIGDFTKIVGVDGREAYEAFCPLDENLRNCYYEGIKKIASMQPDIIMLDDDFRLNIKPYSMGCCCENHLKLFYEEVGEVIPREKLEEAVFGGGENKYRSAWLKVMGKSLVDFAKYMRKAVDEVDESIRLGSCGCYSTWDYDGTDMIEISKAFAGKTKPFIRTIGAPYRSDKVQYAVEHTRMQTAWCKNEDIEIFTEGDVYPRPRYAVPSRLLEIFDMALLASGETDGILKYMFDYRYDVNYETGYVDRHIRNQSLREGIEGLFKEKKHTGIRVFEEMHKVEKHEFEYHPGVAKEAENVFFSLALKLLSENAIPTVYSEDADYPVIVFGENAKYIEKEALKNGAILDVVAARILSQRGVDTGLYKSEPCDFSSEYFPQEEETILNITGAKKHKGEIAEEADVQSTFLPGEHPASYLYENKDGQRFYVLMIDSYRSDRYNCHYFNQYYRQAHLIKAVEWLCGKPLPAICVKNPYLYMQTARSKDGEALSVVLFNINLDEIPEPEIILDKVYHEIKFLNCSGELCGNTVRLSGEIAPYGVAAFEVR